MVTKIQKWGNSQGLRFTKSVLDEARIRVGDEVEVIVENGRIIVAAANRMRGRHSLKKLVAGIPKQYKAEELNWGAPCGKEVW